MKIYVVVKEECDDMDPGIHVGKRSSAGPYCWDCRVTLCKDGELAIHYEGHDWFEACPKCGKLPVSEGLRSGAVAVELGFSPPRAERPTGVSSCSSFSWAQPPEAFRVFSASHSDEQIVLNEYGDRFTGKEFWTMLEINCPVQFETFVGKFFA